MLTAQPPFRGVTPLDTLQQVQHDDATPPSRLNARVPRDLETICLKCLRKEFHQRYPTAAALADDLLRFLDSKPVLAHPLGLPGRVHRWTHRRPAVAGLLAALALALAAGFGFSWYFALDALTQKGHAIHHAHQAGLRAEGEKAARVETEQALRRAEVARLALQLDIAQREIRAGNPMRAAEVLDTVQEGLQGEWEYRYLRALVDSRVRTLRGHTQKVSGAAFSPDDKLIASAGHDGTVRLWDWRQHTEVRLLEGHTGPVACVAFSPNGRYLASGGLDGVVRLWDVASGRPVRVFRGNRAVC